MDRLREKGFHRQINRVIVLSPDRLARKYAHQLILLEEFKRLNVSIEFVNRTISDSPEDQLLSQIQGVIAEYEKEKIIERSRRGKIYKAKMGKVRALSNACFGYSYLPAKFHGEAEIRVNESEARIVTEIYEMYLKRNYSMHHIAKFLTEQKTPTRRGGPRWHQSTVRQILSNPAYIGQAAYGKTRTCPRKNRRKTGRIDGYTKHVNSSREVLPSTEWITIPVPQLVNVEDFNAAK